MPVETEATKPSIGSGPLSGTRVLDLSRVLAGPWCTQCLADLGADVLKVEHPEDGDETRSWGPFYMGGHSAYFACANRSKRSLACDLKAASGQALIKALAGQADVLIENFKFGALERFGLGYDDLKKINPRLIYCSISGYGRSGPEAARAGYDLVIQAESGLMSITGQPDGAPTKVGVAVSDLFAGMYASQAILAALIERSRTGLGQHLDVALFDCQLAALANVASGVLAGGGPPGRYGNAHASVVPYEVFDARDGAFVLAVGNDGQFRTLCRAVLKDEGLSLDPAFAKNPLRLKNRDALRARLAGHFKTEPRRIWLDRLRQSSIPAGAIRTVDEALRSDQVEARGLVHGFPDTDVRVVRHPVRFERGTSAPRLPPSIGAGGEEAVKEWLGAAGGLPEECAPLPPGDPGTARD